MNKWTHLLIGRLVFDRCVGEHGIRLRRGCFLFGCILPDLYLSFLTKPHELNVCRPTVCEEIGRLAHLRNESARPGRYYAVKLGVICHYLADFFCYPHSATFEGGVAAHAAYERKLGRYYKESVVGKCTAPDFSGLTVYDAGALMTASLDSRQRAYDRETPSFDRDIRYSFDACYEAVLLLTSAREAGDDPPSLPDFDLPAVTPSAAV